MLYKCLFGLWMIFSHQRNETKLLIFSSPSQGPATDSGQDWKQKQPWCRWTYEMRHIETGWFLKPSSRQTWIFHRYLLQNGSPEEPTTHQSCLYLDACLVPSDECWSKTWREIPENLGELPKNHQTFGDANHRTHEKTILHPCMAILGVVYHWAYHHISHVEVALHYGENPLVIYACNGQPPLDTRISHWTWGLPGVLRNNESSGNRSQNSRHFRTINQKHCPYFFLSF